MKTHIFLIRHCESVWNSDTPEDRFNGRTDIPLSQHGVLQSMRLAKYFSDKNVSLVYSSPLKRASTTGSQIASKLDCDVVISKTLTEIDFGDWEGLTIRQIEDKYSILFTTWTQDPATNKPPSGESGYELASRVLPFFWEIANKHENETIVVVGHKVVNRIILCHCLGISISLFRKTIPQRVGAINLIVTEQNVVDSISLLDDLSYLALES